MGFFKKLKLYAFERALSLIRKFLLAKQVREAIAGTMRFQKPFEHLHAISLEGMNIGAGGHVLESGEENVLNIVAAKINNANSSPVLFDVGANIGLYAQLLYKKFGSKAIIHSFEPAKGTFEQLKKNVAGTSVQIHPFGIGDAHKTITLHYDEALSAGASVFNRRLDHFGNSMGITEEINITTLPRFCSENQISHIDFLKLDIEGFEFMALSEAREMLKDGSIRFIQFEFGGANIDSKSSLQDFWYLLSPHYNLYRIVKDGIFKIDAYKEDLELYMTTNFLAEYKQPK